MRIVIDMVSFLCATAGFLFVLWYVLQAGRRRTTFGKRIGYVLNAVAALLAVRFLTYPMGAALFLPFDGLALVGLAVCGVVLGLPFSCVDLFTKNRTWDGVVGIVLSLTPVPVYLAIFVFAKEMKHFRLW
jgi:hypothetical protein